jgi:hypothetical protein
MVDFGPIASYYRHIAEGPAKIRQRAARRRLSYLGAWADWDDIRLSGYLHDVFSTLVVPDYDKRGPQPPEPILGDF